MTVSTLIEMIVEIREIALFTRATPGISLLKHKCSLFTHQAICWCVLSSETSMDVSDVLAHDFRFSAFDNHFYSTLQSLATLRHTVSLQ